MALYTGPLGSSKSFAIPRKFMCRICYQLAVGPKMCACGVIICSECCEYKARWNENGTKKYLLQAKPHLVAGSDFKSRQKCEGPVCELTAED